MSFFKYLKRAVIAVLRPFKDWRFLAVILLCAVTMFRRWCVFFTIGFLLCAALSLLPFREKRVKFLKMLAGFTVPMVVLFHRYIYGVLLRENYAAAYSAYQLGLRTDVKFMLRYFGALFLCAIAAYSVYSAVSARKNARKCESTLKRFDYKTLFSGLFPGLCCAVTFIAFAATQSFGQQHLLLFAAPFALIVLTAALKLLTVKPPEKAEPIKKRLVRISAYAVAAFCFVSVFIPRPQPSSIGEIKDYALLPSFSVYPPMRKDASELEALDAYVQALDGKTAVLASSFTLNAD